MATLYGDQYSDAYVEVPSSKIQAGDLNGIARYMYFSYPVPSVAPADADIIKLGKLPKGARVIDALLQLPDLGNTTQLELGYAASAELDSAGVTVEAADTDAFLAAIDGDIAIDCFTMISAQEAGGTLAGHLKKFLGEVDVQILITDAWTSTTTTDSIKGYIKYIIG